MTDMSNPPAACAPGRFLSIKDVARETSLSPQTIRRWVRAGKFPPSRPIESQRVIWLESEVEAWKASVLAQPDSARQSGP